MVTPGRHILWDHVALSNFQAAIMYIRNDSPKNAEKIKIEILSKVDDLSRFPEKYPPDKFKKNNKTQLFRAFELHHYRISYKITEETIIIVLFRHTSMMPVRY